MVERIRDLCNKEGISIARLERDLGFANGSIAKSNGRIESYRLKAIADYFGVDMEYILTGEIKGKENKETRLLTIVFRDKEMMRNLEMLISIPEDLRSAVYAVIRSQYDYARIHEYATRLGDMK